VERKNRTLLDMARTMLDEYKTRDRFWVEAFNTACYSINQLCLLESSRKHRMNSSLVKRPMFLILKFLGANALFLLREVEIQKLLLKQ
jgi:hypothetical protein